MNEECSNQTGSTQRYCVRGVCLYGLCTCVVYVRMCVRETSGLTLKIQMMALAEDPLMLYAVTL